MHPCKPESAAKLHAGIPDPSSARSQLFPMSVTGPVKHFTHLYVRTPFSQSDRSLNWGMWDKQQDRYGLGKPRSSSLAMIFHSLKATAKFSQTSDTKMFWNTANSLNWGSPFQEFVLLSFPKIQNTNLVLLHVLGCITPQTKHLMHLTNPNEKDQISWDIPTGRAKYVNQNIISYNDQTSLLLSTGTTVTCLSGRMVTLAEKRGSPLHKNPKEKKETQTSQLSQIQPQK